MKGRKKHFILWDIDADDYMHYLTYQNMSNDTYNYLKKYHCLIPSFWLAL